MEVKESMVEPRVDRTSVAEEMVRACSYLEVLARLTDSDNGGNSLKGGRDLSEDKGDGLVEVDDAADVDDLAGLEATNGTGNGADSVLSNITDGADGVGGDGDDVSENITGLVDDLGDELGDGGDLDADGGGGTDTGQRGGVLGKVSTRSGKKG